MLVCDRRRAAVLGERPRSVRTSVRDRCSGLTLHLKGVWRPHAGVNTWSWWEQGAYLRRYFVPTSFVQRLYTSRVGGAWRKQKTQKREGSFTVVLKIWSAVKENAAKDNLRTWCVRLKDSVPPGMMGNSWLTRRKMGGASCAAVTSGLWFWSEFWVQFAVTTPLRLKTSKLLFVRNVAELLASHLWEKNKDKNLKTRVKKLFW